MGEQQKAQALADAVSFLVERKAEVETAIECLSNADLDPPDFQGAREAVNAAASNLANAYQLINLAEGLPAYAAPDAAGDTSG